MIKEQLEKITQEKEELEIQHKQKLDSQAEKFAKVREAVAKQKEREANLQKEKEELEQKISSLETANQSAADAANKIESDQFESQIEALTKNLQKMQTDTYNH